MICTSIPYKGNRISQKVIICTEHWICIIYSIRYRHVLSCLVMILACYNVRHIHMISLPTFFTFASQEFGNLMIVQRQLASGLVSSGWLKDTAICHPGDLQCCPLSSGWHKVIWNLSHPDELVPGRISSGWIKDTAVCHLDDDKIR